MDKFDQLSAREGIFEENNQKKIPDKNKRQDNIFSGLEEVLDEAKIDKKSWIPKGAKKEDEPFWAPKEDKQKNVVTIPEGVVRAIQSYVGPNHPWLTIEAFVTHATIELALKVKSRHQCKGHSLKEVKG